MLRCAPLAGCSPELGRIEVRDLYARYPDYFIDTAAERGRAMAARRVAWWQCPVHWYSPPPLSSSA